MNRTLFMTIFRPSGNSKLKISDGKGGVVWIREDNEAIRESYPHAIKNGSDDRISVQV